MAAMAISESYYNMNAYQYLASLPYIHYHNLLLAKKFDGWQGAVEAYCPFLDEYLRLNC
jgi:hypothetical protein